MADDWRLTVDFDDEGDGTQLVEWLSALRFEADERDRLGGRVVVSRDGPRIFLYADSETDARDAEGVVRSHLSSEQLEARVQLERWHPVEQDWKDASVPLPETAEEVRAEHETQQAREAAESREQGYAEWEVRVSLEDRDATAALADRLRDEGVPVVRRSTFLLVGAANRDEADELAERLRGEAPAGARVEVEPGGGMVWEVTPQNPFAVFGGLGG
ncbi:MAG: hypothetical protein ACRDNI_09525 [Gaiellaceae bacterium]